jgi:hypothetical protein
VSDWLRQRSAEVWATGPGLRIVASRAEGLPLVAPDLWDPQPEALLRVGLERYRAGQRDDVWGLEPLYARPSSAEEKWDKPGGR